MTDRWDRRVDFACSNVLSYIESRKIVCCKIHGANQPFSLVQDSSGWRKVCNQCVENFFKEIGVPVKPEVVDVCFEDGCTNDANPAARCLLCQELFCNIHMTDDFVCQSCTEKTDNGLT
jgi:hypothetical protein